MTSQDHSSISPPEPATSEPPADGPHEAPRFSVDYLDRSVDPGVDFYRFAVGRWIERNPVPKDRSRWSGFDELERRNFELLRTILEESAGANGPQGAGPVRQVGDFYASAMDTERIEKLRFDPIQPTLRSIDALDSLSGLPSLLAGLHRAMVPALFIPIVHADRRNSSVYAMYFYQAGLSLPDREYYLHERFAELREQYRAHLEQAFGLLGEGKDAATRDADHVFSLETELARASRARADLRDAEKNYHRFTPEELAHRHPHLAWSTYLPLRTARPLPYVIVGQPEFLDAVDRLLGERTIPEWKSYLRWHLYHSSAPFLHAAVDDANFEFFQKKLLGQEQPEPRWKRAARTIDSEIGEALGQLYVRRHFPPESRQRMQELVDDLRSVFRERLSGLEWMTPETREKARTKFDRFTAKIGHPDTFRDYASVAIRRGEYLENVRRSTEFETQRGMDRIGGPVDRTEWGMTPPMVNAYFNATQNEIVFPAGILQPPFFDSTLDDAVNYGAIGAVIGHEITHGYDDQGRKFDAEGNLNDWWAAADAREFDARAQRVREQYNGFEPLPGEFVNGQLTLGENIADLGGVRLAYAALLRRLSREPERRQTVDGWTPEQRFFLAYAQIWRSTCREGELRRRLAIDPHSPPPYRVQGVVTNLPEFSAAFGIAPGRPMSPPPEKQVTIW
ncbi:MAG: M13 family metallopeptidase [Thermoplasmata archaeon]|nr:M13 family metallopeptidase [Thermoplasmata archaeon]